MVARENTVVMAISLEACWESRLYRFANSTVLAAAGQAGPFAMERLLTHNNHHSQLLWIAGFVLAGGCALRFCLVQAGLYDVTQVPGALFGLSMG